MRGPGEAGSYFQKPSLDDMGPGTDTALPDRPERRGEGYFRKNSLDEMTVGRTEKPAGKTPPKKPSDDSPAPIRRERIGRGSYEDPADEKRRKRRPGKTGRPGQ